MTVGGGGLAPEQMAGLARCPKEGGAAPGEAYAALDMHTQSQAASARRPDGTGLPSTRQTASLGLVYSWSKGQAYLGPSLLICKMGQS